MKDHFLVTAYPVPLLRLPRRRGPFNARLDSFTALHNLGTSAIYWACRGLRLEPGTRIWMPSLHCGVEVQAALDAGLNVGFYRLLNGLTIDEDDLENKLRDCPGVVFVIHYFGFGQPNIERIAKLCRSAGSVLMEDCAHALFSKHARLELGDFAPIAIFSLRKTLPIPDGGALKVNAELLRHVTERPFEPPPSGKFSLDMSFGYPKSAARAALGSRVAGFYRRFRWRSADVRHRSHASEPNFRSTQQYNFGMSALSRWVAASVEPAQVSERRRRNYLTLDRALIGTSGYCKVFEHLPEGVCPLFLPVWVAERETLRSALRSQGVETFRFGARPHTQLNGELRLEAAQTRDNILCLPVHDQITDGDVDKMSRILRPLLSRHQFSQRASG
jgi:perosamine synthetase